MEFETFRSHLMDLLQSRGHSFSSLGAALKLSPSTLSRWVAGDRAPTLEYVIKIADYFNVSVDWLLGRDGDRYNIVSTDIQEITTLYTLATEDDRNVVKAVLNKYRKE